MFSSNEADFGGENKRNLLGGYGEGLQILVIRWDEVLELKKTVSRGDQFFFGQEEPFGMGEITRSHQGDPLHFGPVGEGVQGHIAGCRPRKFGVNVKVGDKFHGRPIQVYRI